MCARRIRTQTEWNVAISGAGIPAGSSRAATRRAISPAALFGNVTEGTCLGWAPRPPRSQAIRGAMTRGLPLPAPASTSSGPSPAVTASRCGGFRSRRSASRSSTTRLYRRDRARLLDGDGLGEVARLVHVAAEAHGDVVREELERHDREQRGQQLGAGQIGRASG